MTDIKVGDLITAYRSGYHVVTRLNLDHSYTLCGVTHKAPQVYYRTLMLNSGKAVKGSTEYQCHLSFCRKVTEEYVSDMFLKETEAASNKYARLMELLKLTNE